MGMRLVNKIVPPELLSVKRGASFILFLCLYLQCDHGLNILDLAGRAGVKRGKGSREGQTAMIDSTQWDWGLGRRLIADLDTWRQTYPCMQEPYVSPDGEKIAAIVKTDEDLYTVYENQGAWEDAFDKVWYLRYDPRGIATALVSRDGQWTLAQEGRVWDSAFDFVWNTRFASEGGHIAVAAQQERKYFAVRDGIPWHTGYLALSDLEMSPQGQKTAAVVQTVPLTEGDIFTFQKGCYSVAVDGDAWNANYVNAWEPTFNRDGTTVAAQVRTSLKEYTIAVDGVPWDGVYSCVWKPQFAPKGGSVTAPVREGGAWTLQQDGRPLWTRKFVQLWAHTYSPGGERLAAIGAVRFGRWTMVVDGKPWAVTFGDLVTDAVFSPDGAKIACVGKEKGKYTVAVDGSAWEGAFDRAWQPVFSPDGRHVAAKVKRNGRFTVLVDGRCLRQEYEEVFDPVFSPDGTRLLIKALEVQGGARKYFRHVVRVADILGGWGK